MNHYFSGSRDYTLPCLQYGRLASVGGEEDDEEISAPIRGSKSIIWTSLKKGGNWCSYWGGVMGL